MQAPDARSARSTVGDRYRVLLDIGRTLAGTLTEDELCAAIHREAARIFVLAGFYISLYDEEADQATVVYFADRDDVRRVRITYPGSESEVVRTRSPVLVRDGLVDRSFVRLGEDASEVTRSAMAAPMLHKKRLIGAVSIQSYEPDAYNEEDLALLQAIADIAAVAIDNAHHIAELDHRRREAERVEEIGRAVASSLDPKEVLRKIVTAVTEVLEVDGSAVWLCDAPTGRVARVAESFGDISLPLGLNWDLTGELADRLIQDREPVVLNDLRLSALIPSNVRTHLEAGSGVAVPLVVGTRVAGLLTAGTRAEGRFGRRDVLVLQRLANQASIALENARLHSNLQALSLTDPLTGLPNRRRLQIHMDKEVAAARRGRQLVVVVFDLDNFKHYNDTMGHLVGDDILRAFAQILADENRAMNLVARYGGDEFVSILSDADMEGARLYIRRVESRVEADPILSSMGVTVSIGIAEFDRAAMKTMDDVIQAADTDMYHVKGRTLKGRRAASP